MSKSIKVQVKHKSDAPEDPAVTAKHDEALHFVQGLRKKGDNVKVMVDKLNEHGHLRPDGQPWDYDSLNSFIHEEKI